MRQERDGTQYIYCVKASGERVRHCTAVHYQWHRWTVLTSTNGLACSESAQPTSITACKEIYLFSNIVASGVLIAFMKKVQNDRNK